MLDLLNRFSIVLILPAVALAFFVGAYFYFYQGSYDPAPSGQLRTQHITPPVSSFTNLESISPVQQGTLLVDMGHSNGFSRNEISSFLTEISRRGYSLEFLELSAGGKKLSEGGNSLAEQLRSVDSFLVIQPSRPFSNEEAVLVHQFVEEKGGKLLLIADPTRNHRMNSLSKEFGITFRPDYLHNSVDYDLNFQNIYISDFKPDKLTDGLGRIALYAAGSLESAHGGLAIADANTQSTFVERVEPLYPMARSEQGGVVALTDLTFLIPPQSTIVNNPRLISNLADFLTTSERSFDLADFPYFFDETAEIILGSPSLLDAGVGMTNVLSGFQVASEIRNVADPNRDLVYLGLYDDAPSVAQYLQLTGVEIGDELRTPFTPAIARDESAVAVLYQDEQREVLIVLGDTPDDVDRVLRQLENGSFRQGLVGDFVGVY
jgi:hypothetical protein